MFIKLILLQDCWVDSFTIAVLNPTEGTLKLNEQNKEEVDAKKNAKKNRRSKVTKNKDEKNETKDNKNNKYFSIILL